MVKSSIYDSYAEIKVKKLLMSSEKNNPCYVPLFVGRRMRYLKKK
jgi:hypothetical protein